MITRAFTFNKDALTQMTVQSSASKTFSTPLCKNRYRNKEVFTERCLFYRLISTPKQLINGIYRKICDLAKKSTAFLVRNRGPPSEI
jgi:hypothetical protein